MSALLKQAEQCLLAGDFLAAEALSRQAMARPGTAPRARRLLADVLYNQGVSLLVYGEMTEAAEKAFHSATEHDPKHVLALHNLGAINDQRGNLDLAIGFYRQALAADARHLPSLQGLATACQRQDRLDEAAAAFDRLARIDLANAGLYQLRNALLIRSIIPDAAYLAAVRARMNGRLDACLAAKLNGQAPEKHVAPYFFLSYHGLPNAALHQKIALAHLHACPSLAWRSPGCDAPRPAGARIRIGIASANLHNHSIGHTTRGLVEKLDRQQFEVVVIRLGRSPGDDMAKAIDDAADAVATVTATDLQPAREQIAALRLDILFYQDLGMEPFSYLLSFARLAPVQVTSFGHPDTTGVPNMDYFISSALYECAGAQDHYTEELVLLPDAGTLSYYYRPEKPQGEVRRTEFGLDDEAHVYFCPQTLFKMHPDMDAVFFGILARDPAACIVLIEPPQTPMRQALEARWRRRGETLASRIVFVKRMPHADYLRLMRCADVMLDTVHFNGQNTNLEAFSLGIPVLTWPGYLQRERHTLGMYKAMGEAYFADLIASDADDYADKAVKIAGNRDLRSKLQALIAQHSPVLYESTPFVRGCEQAFSEMLARAGRADSPSANA